ncbi:hypothetical protein XELAEV_18022518mg [Xenopus laevis]|uniref:Uncharacterized protein n=1 Tax=Xenopus laevis TaxID=8355 RepID=A0A974HNG8_XENLA|nr:hypothetical protein XELAEV_18022518mg [Xenopus laevis]
MCIMLGRFYIYIYKWTYNTAMQNSEMKFKSSIGTFFQDTLICQRQIETNNGWCESQNSNPRGIYTVTPCGGGQMKESEIK